MSLKAPRNPRVVLGLATAFFGFVAVVAAALAVLNDDPTGWGFSAMSAGFAIMGLATFAFGPADARGKRAPGPVGWVLLLVGAAVMSVGPFVLHATGTGWGDVLGSGRRSGSLGFLGLLIWGGAVSIVVAALRSAVRALRGRRSDSESEQEPPTLP